MKSSPPIIEQQTLRPAPSLPRRPSPARTGALLGSVRAISPQLSVMDPKTWTVPQEFDVPGIPWAATSTVTRSGSISAKAGHDRWLHHYVPGKGFSEREPILCPDYTGSYLSHDGKHLYLSQ